MLYLCNNELIKYKKIIKMLSRMCDFLTQNFVSLQIKILWFLIPKSNFKYFLKILHVEVDRLEKDPGLQTENNSPN